MYKILKKESLNKNVTRMKVYAPYVAKKALEGQFIILRVDKDGERIPLTIADYDRDNGTIDIIFQVIGATTVKLNKLNEGEYINDFVGPLGNPTDIDNIKRAVVVGGGVGCAIAYPIAKKLHKQGVYVDSIIGFKTKELVILEDEFEKISNKVHKVSDDGSFGEKGFTTNALQKLIEEENDIDLVIAIGPIIMMKLISEITREKSIKTIVSMNPIMIDGTGMCGGCRLKVGDKMKFACIDGPDFDGHLVDFDDAMNRNKMYNEFEKKAFSDECNLIKKINKNKD